MSSCFRPVLEQWGACSDCFVGTDLLLRILEVLADETVEVNYAGTYFEISHADDMKRVWILRGRQLLELVQRAEFSGQWLAERLDELDDDLSDVSSVADNMKALALAWVPYLDGDGSLRFYVDHNAEEL
jgi:hypothetical protein